MSSRYVVTRQNWKRLASTAFARLPGTVDVAAFDTFAEAAADRDRRAAAARASVNPFAWGDSLFDVTRLAPHALCDWLQEAGLSTPPTDAPRDEWVLWWELAKSVMTDEQAARVWGVFDQLRLFDVEERPRRVGLFALTVIPWSHPDGDDENYNDQFASYEGGDRWGIYRTLNAAEAGADAVMADDARQQLRDPHYNNYSRCHVGARACFAADPLGPLPAAEVRRSRDPGGIPWTDIAPLELVADPADVRHLRRVFAVIRLGWSSEEHDGFRRWMPPDVGEVGLPVLAFADRAAAESDAWNRDVAARQYLNPFRFGPPAHLTGLNESAYRAMLFDLGLDLPSGVWTEYFPLQPAWAAWWEHAASLLADDQRETVWDLLDKLRFHQVVELELRG